MHDSNKVMTLHISTGLEYPVAAKMRARKRGCLFYVGATRATQRLVIGVSENGEFAARL